MKFCFRGASGVFLLAWGLHLATATAALRGFFGDGALVFLLNLSKSYMMGGQGHTIYLYSAHTPRDFQFLLNGLALQAGLWLRVGDPWAMKYLFNFWQFTLPGFLYLALFAGLACADKLAWGIFPLMSWAVLSVPVDWNAVNSTRWAVPLFWTYLFVVLFARSRLDAGRLLLAFGLGIAMLGGLYETILPLAVMAMLAAGVIWYREDNRVPMLYAIMGMPGAIRAFYSYFIAGGQEIPGGAPSLVLLQQAGTPFFLFICVSLVAAGLLLGRQSSRRLAPLAVLISLWLAALIYAAASSLPDIWPQISMRYDYMLVSLALMGWAALWRLRAKNLELPDVMPAAALCLASGTFLWLMQVQGTFAWQLCRADYNAATETAPLVTDASLLPLFKPRSQLRPVEGGRFSQCLWDWTAPWTDLLLQPHVAHWPQFTFWQNFAFTEQTPGIYLRTNNWTLVSPAVMRSQADLPLKTALYDLTPLYRSVGSGSLFARRICLPPSAAGPYWQNFVTKLDDDNRRVMFVCPRAEAP